jgi:hypothetical protein
MDFPIPLPTHLIAVIRFLCRDVTDFKRGVSGLPPQGERICPRCGGASRPAQHVSGARVCSSCGHSM